MSQSAALVVAAMLSVFGTATQTTGDVVKAVQDRPAAVSAQSTTTVPKSTSGKSTKSTRNTKSSDFTEVNAPGEKSSSSDDTESESPTTDDKKPSNVSDVVPSDVTAEDEATWDKLAQCESGGDWSIDTGNGFYGGIQFTQQSWEAAGGTEYAPIPNQATREQQISIGKKLKDMQGWGAWPACSAQLGLR